ncbi:MAG: hypothetical protein LJE94_03595, partial [Deltaproteobacteria bacterium]|nr:hypothetical protein [Deltaproteobacteria bacterium]
MKKAAFFILVLFFAALASMPSAFGGETTLLGPQQYLRFSDAPDTYENTFRAVPGYGTIVVRNGKSDGDKRIEDGISSASILVNGIEVFGPEDFNQNTYLLTSPLELSW